LSFWNRSVIYTSCVLLLGCATHGKNIEQRYNRGTEYYSKALYSDAEREFLSLAKDMPDNYDVFFRLGNIYVRTGQLDAAERMYQRCLVIDPKQPKGWYNLSLLRVKQALYLTQEGAEKSADQDPEFAPRFVELRRGLINALGEK
jgi:tetratricopeptide (TPR) repeat protein